MKRNKTSDDRKEATELTTVIVKLETISRDTSEIKSELRNVKNEMGELRERVTISEQVGKSLHRRVDSIEETVEKLMMNAKNSKSE